MGRAKPLLSAARVPPTVAAVVTGPDGAAREVELAGEHALALFVDGREVISLMTMGQMPEALAVGWLLSQRMIGSVGELEEVRVDWEAGAAAVYTRGGTAAAAADDGRRTVTSGCGQGTMFSRVMEQVERTAFVRAPRLGAGGVFDLLGRVRDWDTVYKRAGAVHACALARAGREAVDMLCFVEDIGRHNAADAIGGWMALNEISGDGTVFYTTGRLTSEMVIKCAQMRVPYLVSRSGTTAMGCEVARAAGVTMLGRAVNRRYVVFSGGEFFDG